MALDELKGTDLGTQRVVIERAPVPVFARAMGDDPEADKRGLRAAYRRLCEERAFDTLLVAHGLPWVGDAREALRRFVLQP